MEENPMTDTIPARILTSFENRMVTRAKVEIPGAAGGLREALDFDPIELCHDQEVMIVMRARVKKVRFDEIKESDCLARVHVLEPLEGETAFADDGLERVIEEFLRGQSNRIKVARMRAAGLEPLFDEDGNPLEPAEPEPEAEGE